MSSAFLDPHDGRHPPSPVPSSTLGVSPPIPHQPTFSATSAARAANNPFSSLSPDTRQPLALPTTHPAHIPPPIVTRADPLNSGSSGQARDRRVEEVRDRTSSGSNLVSPRDSRASSSLWTGHSLEDNDNLRLSAIGREFPRPPTDMDHRAEPSSSAGLGLDPTAFPADGETEDERDDRKRRETLKELSRRRAAAAQWADRPSYFEMYEPEGGRSSPLRPRPGDASSSQTPTTPGYPTSSSVGPSPSRSSFVSTSTARRTRNPFTNSASSPDPMPSPTASNAHSGSASATTTPVQTHSRHLAGGGDPSYPSQSHSRAGSVASSRARSEGRQKRLSSLYSSSSLPQAPYPSGPIPLPPLPASTTTSQAFPTEPNPTPPSRSLELPDTPSNATFRTISESSTGAGAFQSSGGSVNSHASANIVTAKRASTATALASPGFTLQSAGVPDEASGRGLQERLIDNAGDERSSHRSSALNALEGRGTPSPLSPPRSGPPIPLGPLTPPPRALGSNYSPAASSCHLLTPTQQETVNRLLNSPSISSPAAGASHTPDLAFLAGPSDYPFPHISSSPTQPPKAIKRHSDAPSASSRRSTRFAAFVGARSDSMRSSSNSHSHHPYNKSSRPSSAQSTVSTPQGIKRTPSRIKRWEAGLSLAKLVKRADRVVEILDQGAEAGGRGYVHSPAISSSRKGKFARKQGSLRSWVSGGGGGGTSSRRSTGRAGVAHTGESDTGGEFTELSDRAGLDETRRADVVIGRPPSAPPPVPDKTAMRRRSLGKRLSAMGGRWAGGKAVDEDGAERALMVEKEVGVVVIGYGADEPREMTGVEISRPSKLTSAHDQKPLPVPPEQSFWTRRKKIVLAAVVVLVLLILLISLPVALLAGKDHAHDSATGGVGTPSNCPQGTVGSFCNLNSTCVCTSSPCLPLAASLVTLTQTGSTIFNTTLSPSALALFLSPQAKDSTDCSAQALLVDLGSGFDPSKQPRRLEFAQAALVWQLVKTEDLSTVATLQTFASNINLAGVPDGPVAMEEKQADRFRTISAGWRFDLARMEVTAPVLSWEADTKPNEFQKSLVGGKAVNALSRIATLASAASAQSSLALSNYWTTTLSLPSSSLPTFLALLRSSPILLPFSAPDLISLTRSPTTSASFPPPLACNPALTPAQRSTLSRFESSVFGLPSIPAGQAGFDSPACVSKEGVLYGMLDLLHLRTPFLDDREGVARQAVVLNEDVKVRATLKVGELLAPFPAGGNANTTEQDLDPREHATFQHLDHLALAFLRAVPSVAIAQALISFLLSPPTTTTPQPHLLPLPPSLATAPALFPYLASLPTIEIALLGSVPIQAINYTLSSFTSSSNDLFFGSPGSQTMRLWATQQQPPTGGLSPAVVWSEGALSERVVVQQTNTQPGFERVFQRAARGAGDLGSVVKGLEEEGLFVA